MIKFAINTFGTCSSCKIYTKPRRPFLIKFVCFCISCIYFRITFIKWWSSFYLLISICQVLIIPNIVVIVAFYIGCVFLWFLDLPSCSSLHPFLDLLVSKLFIKLVIFFELFVLCNYLILFINLILVNVFIIWILLLILSYLLLLTRF